MDSLTTDDVRRLLERSTGAAWRVELHEGDALIWQQERPPEPAVRSRSLNELMLHALWRWQKAVDPDELRRAEAVWQLLERDTCTVTFSYDPDEGQLEMGVATPLFWQYEKASEPMPLLTKLVAVEQDLRQQLDKQ